jgi:quercetin dioxygenase-like cupin family protein
MLPQRRAVRHALVHTRACYCSPGAILGLGVVVMKSNYTYISDLAKEVDIPADGILSRTLYTDEHVKVVVFGFDAGQELSEHTASMPAIIHIIQGEARLTLGDDAMEARAGAWVHLPPELRHSVQAKTPVIMLLMMMRSAPEGSSG